MTYNIQITPVTTWNRVLNAAKITEGKEPVDKEPSDSFKNKMLISQHSPIRLLEYDIVIKNIKYWIAMHLVRHHVGVVPFVSTQREDRNNFVSDRDARRQDALVNLQLSCNAQAILNISHERLCNKAHPETKKLWQEVIKELSKIDKNLSDKCVPKCAARGFCPESSCCNYINSDDYQTKFWNYRKR